ncbi:MAG: hypothetical protein ACE5KL_00995 [Alphaproteobacteria bacterium]
MPDTQKLSKVEAIKEGSRYLRGTIDVVRPPPRLLGMDAEGNTIVEDLASVSTPFSEADYQVLKFHGTYQQYDRDTATERKQRGLEKEYQCMVRVKIPGGRLTADQYLVVDALADRYANSSLRITPGRASSFTVSSRPTSRPPSPTSMPRCLPLWAPAATWSAI